MPRFPLYNAAIHTLSAMLRVGALWNKKLRQGVQGRQDWPKRYAAQWAAHKGKKTLWMHVSSLGEFEQGRPILEAFRQQYPDWCLVLSFFSPSGYEMRKNYPQVDAVVYLPFDTAANARQFVTLLQPDLAIFVKYDFWPHFLHELNQQAIPTLLVSALFRPEQPFFQSYGPFWRKMLHCFTHIFTQTDASAGLLRGVGYPAVTVAGDTRIDRVLQIAAAAADNDTVARFAQGHRVLVVGSSWAKDEDVLLLALQHPALSHLKVVCAPHDPRPAQVGRLMDRLQGTAALTYTEAVCATSVQLQQTRWLVIDNVGMLNTLYKYGHIAYIGGGFGTGIHNTLEPAAFGLPVVFGPKFQKFEEAKQMVRRGGAFTVRQMQELQAVLVQLMDNRQHQAAAQAVRAFLNENKGGTQAVMAWVARWIAG